MAGTPSRFGIEAWRNLPLLIKERLIFITSSISCHLSPWPHKSHHNDPLDRKVLEIAKTETLTGGLESSYHYEVIITAWKLVENLQIDPSWGIRSVLHNHWLWFEEVLKDDRFQVRPPLSLFSWQLHYVLCLIMQIHQSSLIIHTILRALVANPNRAID